MKTDFATYIQGEGAWIEVREFSFGTFFVPSNPENKRKYFE